MAWAASAACKWRVIRSLADASWSLAPAARVQLSLRQLPAKGLRCSACMTWMPSAPNMFVQYCVPHFGNVSIAVGPPDLGGIDIVINCTPLGMEGKPGTLG